MLKTSMTEDMMEPDQNGLWSVCLPLKCCPTRDKEELATLFNRAGEVKRIMFTPGFAFIRYLNKNEAQQAVDMFEDLQVRFANNSKTNHNIKKSEAEYTSTNNLNRARSYGMQNGKTYDNKNFRHNKGTFHHAMDNSDNGRDDSLPEVENAFGGCNLDGFHSEQDRPNGSSSESTSQLRNTNREVKQNQHALKKDSDLRMRSLFVANIESEVDFKHLIKPFSPKQVIVRSSKNGRKIAFLTMSNQESARHVIQDLRNKKQTSLRLLVDYNRNVTESDSSDTLSEISSTDLPYDAHSEMNNHKMPHLERESTDYKMPHLERELAGMPPLIHVSQLGAVDEHCHFELSLYVANFPRFTLDSALRRAFSRYHIVDICMINNGSSPGRTKANLYLATVYDVIQAVIEMNGSCIFGYPLAVEVPYKNLFLRCIVEKELAKLQQPPSLQSGSYSSS